ncbi:cytochrome c oxidase subunit IVB [Salimicrobium halophilum]|uniref:Cytochrome c oxidase subunit 4 n=1 Tax=Salimicrobium halophilum TaxID=86666 RepID=A0A1G8QHC2_9BACI|nr:cytochrome c oxidase subunit IVB [Salimicrobium halophilum]SDJ04071.1 cytochrome c oxidase subunit 4 [Salimicrobium halophilum]
MTDHTDSTSKHKIDIHKKEHKEEMIHQVISFTLMILFTFIAFGMVILEISSYFVKPVLILLAVVQVVFQLYYFMHMKNKGHTMPAMMMFSGIAVAILTIITFTTIIWW